MVKKKGSRFYQVGQRYRIHGYDKKGKFRILRWENVEPTLDKYIKKRKGEYRIVEWTRYYEYKSESASSFRNFEVRIQLPEGYDINEIEEMMDAVMDGLIYNSETGEPTHTWFNKVDTKVGADTIEYSDDEKIRWKVIDNARPQYKYPKNKDWEDYEE